MRDASVLKMNTSKAYLYGVIESESYTVFILSGTVESYEIVYARKVVVVRRLSIRDIPVRLLFGGIAVLTIDRRSQGEA